MDQESPSGTPQSVDSEETKPLEVKSVKVEDESSIMSPEVRGWIG